MPLDLAAMLTTEPPRGPVMTGTVVSIVQPHKVRVDLGTGSTIDVKHLGNYVPRLGDVVHLMPRGDSYIALGSVRPGDARNLWPNPSLEGGDVGWGAFWGGGTRTTYLTNQTSNPNRGTRHGRTNLASTDAFDRVFPGTSLPATPGESYDCYIWARCNYPFGARLDISVISAPLPGRDTFFGTDSIITTILPTVYLSNRYTRYGGRYTIPAGHYWARPHITMAYNTGPTPLDVYFDDAWWGRTVEATLPDTGWIAPSLLNGWMDYGDIWEPAAYRRIGRIVYLRGLIKNGNVGSTIFNLLDGFRPSTNTHSVTVGNGAVGIVNVMADGRVNHNQGSNAWFSLQIPPFVADQ